MWPFRSNKKQLDEIERICHLIIKAQIILATDNKFLAKRLAIIEGKIDSIRRRLGPGLISIKVLGELEMADKLSFVVYLPQKAAPDVVSRELTVDIGGQTQVLELDADQTEVPSLVGLQGDKVVLSLVDVDDAGLRSEASVIEAVLEDTFAPPKPGVLGFEVTGEIFDDEADSSELN